MLGNREKDFELVVSGSWKVWGMASTESKKGIFRKSTEQRIYAALKPPGVCFSG